MKGVTQRNGNTSMVSVSNSENVDEFTHQLEKFKKEARRLFELDNKNIVKVHDLFEENGTAYYVMDYVGGEDLRRWLEREKRPMIEDEVMMILPQVLNALEDVHSKGIWHLDLKPANIMVDSNMTVKLIDFGASKQFDSQRGGVTSSAVAFTNGYAPFEQMEKNHEKFGPWTDFYALGATLYNLLTNKKPPLPSDINDDHTDDKHLALPMPTNVSAKTRDLVLWLMAPGRSARPQSVTEIRNWLNSQSITTSPTQIGQPIEETSIDKKPIIVEEKPTPVEKKAVPTEKKEPHIVKIEDKPRKKSINNYFVYSLALLLLGGLIIGSLSYYGFNRLTTPTGEITEQDSSKPLFQSDVEDISITIPLGKCTYSGNVNAYGMPDGYGTAIFKNGDELVGTFVNGSVSGDEIEYNFSNGDKFYGTIKNDHLSKGRYTVGEDGSYFEGTFKNDQPNKGHWYDKNGQKID